MTEHIHMHATPVHRGWKELSVGMKVMSIMMGACVGATTLLLTAPLLGAPAGWTLGAGVGLAFGAVTWYFHRAMGVLMGICCGAAVLAATLPSMSAVAAVGIATAAGALAGVGSHYGLHRRG